MPPEERPPEEQTPTESPGKEQVLCAKHCVPLEPGKIELTYQGHTFPLEVLRCPVCGEPLVPEDVVRGKMAEVEQTLEEK